MSLGHTVRGFWTVLIILLGLAAGFAGRRKLDVPRSRKLIYFSNAINLLLLAGITTAIDYAHGQTALGLLVRIRPAATVFMWSLCTALACIAVVGLVYIARISLHRPPRGAILAILPRSSGEKITFVLLCLLVGLTEELIYRGFALSVLQEWFRSDALAVAVVAVSFALMHGLQDFISIVSAFAQGLLLCVPVLCIQSLVPAITGHVVVDIFAGLLMLSVLDRAGLTAEHSQRETN